MSGLVGILNLDGAPVNRELLRRMTGYLTPRGPDAQQIWTAGNVGFGHALLRTTWESETEHQPHTLNRTTWIVADCRVDARQDLIRELSEHDSPPPANTPDPELILRAYGVWGERCVDHLLGDFSFAIWDGRRRALFCARDHLGVKPFFYSHVGPAVVFSNDLNCLRLHPAVSGELDEVAIADFLVFGYALDLERSSFLGIRRLPPAHTLTASDAGVSLSRYWQLPLEDEIHYPRRADYIDHFHELLEVAVQDRLRTNRVGVYMSGGLDSTTVAATAHRILSRSGASFDLQAHTSVFDRIVPDEERTYSQLAADAIGIPIHHYPLDAYGLPPPEPELDWYPPEPQFLFDRRLGAADREPAAASRVLLRGEGVDALLDAPSSVLDKLVREGHYGRLAKDFIWLMCTRRRVRRLGIRTIVRRAFGRPTPTPVPPYPGWLAPALEARLDLRRRWNTANAVVDIRPGFELTHSFWSLSCESLDPGTMQLAAEVRYPFLDLRLARYLLRLPPIPWATEKSLLRVAMRGILPSRVLRRPKTPLAGNPYAPLLPPADTSWWDEYMIPAPGLEAFVDVPVAKETLARVVQKTQAINEHKDVDMLRSSLRPISLNLWLRQTACVTFNAPASRLPEVISG